VRAISALIETLGIEDFDEEARWKADEDMAAQIGAMGPVHDRAAWLGDLARLRDSAVREAIILCGLAKEAADGAAQACMRAAEARDAKSVNAGAFHALANGALEKSASAALDAHLSCEVALGRARAISLAMNGTPWRPASGKSDSEWLLAMCA
jgi:hypothetical protein